MEAIQEVMTLMEAVRRWDVPESTLRHYAAGYRRSDGKDIAPVFTESECRKSEGTFLLTRAGMERLFGPETEQRRRFTQTSLFDIE